MDEEIARLIGLKRYRYVVQLLERAAEKRVNAARQKNSTTDGAPAFAVERARLVATLRRALSIRTSGHISIRPRANGGGRSFFFRFYAAGRLVTVVGHQIYVERDGALERAAKSPDGWERELSRSGASSVEEPVEVRRPVRLELGQAAPNSLIAQTYVDDAEKVATSIGNIGATPEERCDFWRLLEEHEPHPSKRVQMRIIGDLPHEATPEARAEMLKKFTEYFRSKNLPFHAVVHAPTEKNDSRNFHMHLLFSDRPATKMVDPRTGDLQWDFAITEVVKARCRHTVVRHPYRQNKHAELRKKSAPKTLRRHFASVVTEVMARHGFDVRYDAERLQDAGHDLPKVQELTRAECNAMKRGEMAREEPNWRVRVTLAEEAQIDSKIIKSASHAAYRSLGKLEEAGRDVEKINSILPRSFGLPDPVRVDWARWDQWLALKRRYLVEALACEAEAICAASACASVAAASRVRRFKVMPRGPDAFTPAEVEDLELLEAVAEEMAVEATQENAKQMADLTAHKAAVDEHFLRLVGFSTPASCTASEEEIRSPARTQAPARKSSALASNLIGLEQLPIYTLAPPTSQSLATTAEKCEPHPSKPSVFKDGLQPDKIRVGAETTSASHGLEKMQPPQQFGTITPAIPPGPPLVESRPSAPPTVKKIPAPIRPMQAHPQEGKRTQHGSEGSRQPITANEIDPHRTPKFSVLEEGNFVGSLDKKNYGGAKHLLPPASRMPVPLPDHQPGSSPEEAFIAAAQRAIPDHLSSAPRSPSQPEVPVPAGSLERTAPGKASGVSDRYQALMPNEGSLTDSPHPKVLEQQQTKVTPAIKIEHSSPSPQSVEQRKDATPMPAKVAAEDIGRAPQRLHTESSDQKRAAARRRALLSRRNQGPGL